MTSSIRTLALTLLTFPCAGQTPDRLITVRDVDSLYIMAFPLHNDIRLLYGTRGSSLIYGTENKNSSITNNYNNINDIVGFGFTYKILDFDFILSLPQTRLQQEGIQNLQQFRISGSYFGRRITTQVFWRDSRGLVATDAGGSFESSPDIHVLLVAVQFTYNFNFRKYSYKAANYQNELQRKSAGSFLVRLEPFYRNVGIGNLLVPTVMDTPVLYGEQAGLAYVHSPGINVLPGYGYNFAFHEGKYFISPFLLAGPGFALTEYSARDGEHVRFHLQWAGTASVNAGYNWKRLYIALRSSYNFYYFKLNPAYFSMSDLKVGITAGYRFSDFEKVIPRM